MQSKFFLEEDNIQDLIKHVPEVKVEAKGKGEGKAGMLDADDIEFAFKGSKTTRQGSSSNQDDYDSEDDDEEDTSVPANNPNMIS